MSLSLLLPFGLAALAALVVPLVLHLIRQPERVVVDFAALRWLGERARPRRRLRFDDPWLLLVRLALLATMALLLAMPVLDRDPRAPAAVVAVMPGIDVAMARADVRADTAEWRWLAPGFPSLDDPAPPSTVSPMSLVRELDAALDPRTTLTVVVPSVISHADGERVVSQRGIEWRVVDAPIEGITTKTDDAPQSVAVALRAPADAVRAERHVRAALAAWNAATPGRYTLDAVGADVALDTATDWLVWLDGDLSPTAQTWLDAGGRAMVLGADDDAAGVVAWAVDGRVLARTRASGKGRLVSWIGSFDPADVPAMLDADFPARWRALFDDAPALPARAVAATMVPRTGAVAATPPTFPLDTFFVALVVLLFVIERALATRRRSVA